MACRRKGRLAVEAMAGLAFALLAMYIILKTWNTGVGAGIKLP